MSDTTAIEWTDATWNPLIGCTSVSPGCDHCYARTQVDTRFHPAALAKGGRHLEAFPAPFDTVSIRPDRFLLQPLHWAKPKRVFVNSLSDLFHKDVPDEFIARVFAVMAAAEQHTFQLLTKRHARMRSLLNDRDFRASVWQWCIEMIGEQKADLLWSGSAEVPWPLPNVHLLVSVENQRWAGPRIEALLATPAAVRGVSAEPLLGQLELSRWLRPAPGCGLVGADGCCEHPGNFTPECHADVACPASSEWRGIDWVIVGGESGPGARPMHPDWARALRDQCVAAGVPFLFKQWGEWLRLNDEARDIVGDDHPGCSDGQRLQGGHKTALTSLDNETYVRVGKRAAGRELDGRTWDEYPVVAQWR